MKKASGKETLLRGLATVNFYTADMKAAKKWYSELLGIEPYFERPDSEHPAYIEFRLGNYQHELASLIASSHLKVQLPPLEVQLYTGMSMMWQQHLKR